MGVDREPVGGYGLLLYEDEIDLLRSVLSLAPDGCQYELSDAVADRYGVTCQVAGDAAYGGERLLLVTLDIGERIEHMLRLEPEQEAGLMLLASDCGIDREPGMHAELLVC